MHSSAQPTLVARDGYGDALPRQVEPLWSDKGFGLPGAGARPDAHFDPGKGPCLPGSWLLRSYAVTIARTTAVAQSP